MKAHIPGLISAIDNRRIGLTSTPLRIGAWAGLLLALSVLALRDYDSFQLGTWRDDASYVGLARALLTPDLQAWLATHPALAALPPGYPLFLAPLIALFPGNFLVLKFSSLVVTLLCATLLYWGWSWYAPGTSYRWAIAVTGLFAVSYLAIEHTRMVMSEPVFTLLSLLALLLAERTARGAARLGPHLLLGALLAFSVLARSVGLILTLTILAYVAIRQGRRRWAPLGTTVAGMVVALALVVWLTPVSLTDIVPSRYLTDRAASLAFPMADIPSATITDGLGRPQVALLGRYRPLLVQYILGGMIQRFGLDVNSVVFPVGGGRREADLAQTIGLPWLPSLRGYLVSGTVILGFVACFIRGKASAFVVFGAAYLAATVLWESAGGRLLYPILPQLILAFLLGVDMIVRGLIAALGAQTLSGARLPFLILFVTLLALLSVRKSVGIPDSRLHVGNLETRSSWIVTHADASTTLMSEEPAVELAYTNRKTVGYPSSCPSPQELTSYLVANQVDFVLVAPRIRWQEEYQPTLSERAQCISRALAALQPEGRAAQVFASIGSHLQIFRIRRD